MAGDVFSAAALSAEQMASLAKESRAKAKAQAEPGTIKDIGEDIFYICVCCTAK